MIQALADCDAAFRSLADAADAARDGLCAWGADITNDDDLTPEHALERLAFGWQDGYQVPADANDPQSVIHAIGRCLACYSENLQVLGRIVPAALGATEQFRTSGIDGTFDATVRAELNAIPELAAWRRAHTEFHGTLSTTLSRQDVRALDLSEMPDFPDLDPSL